MCVSEKSSLRYVASTTTNNKSQDNNWIDTKCPYIIENQIIFCLLVSSFFTCVFTSVCACVWRCWEVSAFPYAPIKFSQHEWATVQISDIKHTHWSTREKTNLKCVQMHPWGIWDTVYANCIWPLSAESRLQGTKLCVSASKTEKLKDANVTCGVWKCKD